MRNHAERIIIVLCLLCSIVAAIMAVRVYFSIISPEEPESAGECLAGYDMEEERFRRHTDQMNLFLLNPTNARKEVNNMKAKQAVKKQKNRSDIPYVERKQMEQNALICWHRDEAARNAMRIALVALNDTEKTGFARLCRFAQRFQELCKAYYADEELEGPRLDRRLESMGFKVMDGKVLVYQDPESGEIVKIDAAEKKRREE